MTTLVKATFVEEKMTDLSFFEEGKVYKVYYDKDRRNNMIEDEDGISWYISHLAMVSIISMGPPYLPSL